MNFQYPQKKYYYKKQLFDQESGELIETEVMKSITIDCAIFGFENGSLEVLLVEHAHGIRQGEWRLPGRWILKDEDIDDAAALGLRK
jgi:ADP-ribose pyrophosphatase YjhB (NUDIX family)